MEDAKRRESLKSRYSSAISISNTGSQESLRTKSKTNSEESTTAAVAMKQSTKNDAEKLREEKAKDSEYQKQIELLQKDLQAKEETIKNQADKISDLNNNLIEKAQKLDLISKDLLSANTLLKEKDDKEELRLQEISKQELELEKMSAALEKQRVENAELAEKIRILKYPAGPSKIEEELEKCLSEETAKTNTIREELEYVIQNINDEKEEFYKYFEEFKESTKAFLFSCDTHRDTVLNAVNQ